MILLLLLVVGAAEHPNSTIPLGNIWGYRIPGTKEVSSLEEFMPKATKPTEAERRKIRLPPREASWTMDVVDNLISTQTAGPALIVKGIGGVALEKLVTEIKSNDPTKSFRSDQPISAVFYAYVGGDYVHLVSVTWTDRNTLTIKYKFVDHYEAISTMHFAIIPLGKLPPGKYVINVPPAKLLGPIIRRDPRERVCKTTTFYVTGEQK